VRTITASLLAGLALIAAGCGSQDDSTPVACMEGASAYEEALKAAPGEVRLEGETPISDCLAPNQTAGDLTRVGEAMLQTATDLNAEIRFGPGSDAPIQLGYLLGAAERGSEESEGIHTDLVRRLTAAARYVPTGGSLSMETFAQYRKGFKAGREDG
jgi:hypothetical protein